MKIIDNLLSKVYNKNQISIDLIEKSTKCLIGPKLRMNQNVNFLPRTQWRNYRGSSYSRAVGPGRVRGPGPAGLGGPARPGIIMSSRSASMNE